jgi:hypothetical protein
MFSHDRAYCHIDGQLLRWLIVAVVVSLHVCGKCCGCMVDVIGEAHDALVM